ncbi:fibroblast growth factor receptor-like 1 isoform X2 [Cephus cinctus]|uniref:Fibroblast growth factor receptor-like 1 isoform X2 n=1 Tax=Cephus cinctus TaxID=211228 RepID=A0AAJ7FCW3_CEPCN|nr:fibroblast growth factor receptor-like 1 isoform X2 [Cephus cinctus]
MYTGAVVLLAVSLSIAVIAVPRQESEFPILSLLTYWSEAESQHNLETLDFGASKELVDGSNINTRGNVIQARAGRKIHLKCQYTAHHSSHRQLQWHYLPCGSGHNQTSCKVVRSALTTDTEWQLVQNQNHLGELVLESPTKADSGLYKCTTIRHDRTFKVVRMFQLEIIDGTVYRPEIVEGPWNVSVPCCGEQKVSLQCRVRSSIHPNVVWFRKFSSVPKSNEENAITYRDAVWKMLPSNQIYLGNQLYLSKLSFDRPATEDTGYYACLAINYKGWTMQGAELTVYLPLSFTPLSNSSRNEDWGRFRFSGLFLIPACLALVPASAWLCYLYHKLRNKHTTPFIS